MELNRMRALTTAAKIERIAYFLLACTVAFFTNRELCRGHDASEDVPVFIPVVEFTPFAGEFLRDALRGVFTFFVVIEFLFLFLVLFLFVFLFLFPFFGLPGDDGDVFICTVDTEKKLGYV